MIDFEDINYISEIDYKKINERSNVDVGDILFGMIGTIGNPVLVSSNDFAIKNVALIKTNNTINNIFLLNIFKSQMFDKYIYIEMSGNTQKFLALNKIRSFKFYLPEKNEQDKIGNILKKIDDIITLEQEKLKRYKTINRVINMNIFPTNAESAPNLSFKNDTEWQVQKLGNFLSIPNKVKVNVKDTNEILSVKLNTNGVVGGESRSTLKLGATTYYRRYSGQFIYGKQNFFNGAMAIIPEALNYKVSSGDIPSLNISNINPIFLYEYLSRPYYYKQTEAMSSGTGSKRIHERTLLNFKIKVPNSDVQDNIEQLFTNLTALIYSQNSKVDKMIQVKKVLLNNLFV